jgi:hypothetical protein
VYYMMSDVTKPQLMGGRKVYLVRDLGTLTAECGTAPVYLDIIDGKADKFICLRIWVFYPLHAGKFVVC